MDQEKDGPEDVDPVFRRKLQETLQVPDVELNGDDADGSESDWDDERYRWRSVAGVVHVRLFEHLAFHARMMQVDEAIAKHFREHLRRTKRNKAVERLTVVHFKMRVLSLLATFAKNEQENPILLDFIPAFLKVGPRGLYRGAPCKGAQPNNRVWLQHRRLKFVRCTKPKLAR